MDKKYRMCKNCEGRFEDKNTGCGRHKIYCSDSCKTMYHLKNRDKKTSAKTFKEVKEIFIIAFWMTLLANIVSLIMDLIL